ncbi:MAG: phosphotransferase [Deltaproteobacteria bacterium]|nr:phosphotransferase [Deltaproteobacteria bacterium]
MLETELETDSGRPQLSLEEAHNLARESFGVEGTVKPLPSYIDQNFKITPAEGQAYVLKVASAEEHEPFLHCQDRLLNHLAEGWPEDESPASFPRPRMALSGSTVTAIEHGGKTHLVRLVTFLEGSFLADYPVRPAPLMERFGRFLGRLDDILGSFQEPPHQREIIWDITHFDRVEPFLQAVREADQRQRLESMYQRVRRNLERWDGQLAKGWIHGDANQHNLLIEASGPGAPEILGLIDFGDLSYTGTIYELAIAAAYAMLGEEDPSGVLEPLVAGYGAVRPISAVEVSSLVFAIPARLITSLALAAHHGALDPENEYVVANQRPAWDLLEWWMGQDAARLEAWIGEICADAR